jgi:iron(III) transport system substrate-binding protein
MVDLLEEKLDEEFPDMDIKIEYMITSNIAAKVLIEKESSECDIVFAQEYAYLEQLAEADALSDLDGLYDFSVFTSDAVASEYSSYIIPTEKTGGGIIINNKVLEDRSIDKPTSYQDLLKPEFKGLISMPNPKSSSTGYMFYLSLVNEWGEEKALEFFDGFAKNVLSFTSSGSGPVNALSQNEVAVGLGMIPQAVEKISGGNEHLEIIFFEEGAPYTLYGSSVVKGKDKKENVMKVMEYLHGEFTALCNQMFYPETVLKDKEYKLENYPTNINYADMSANTLKTKEGLVAKWKH